jgi:hypothetical protein
MKLGVYTAVLHDRPLRKALEVIGSSGLTTWCSRPKLWTPGSTRTARPTACSMNGLPEIRWS